MDDLQRENEQLRREVAELRDRLAEAEAKIKQLTELLGQNSRNSNWPSSRDKSRQRKSSSRRKRSKRSAGGQKGHQGYTLELDPKPDIIEVHRPARCERCTHAFEDEAVVADVTRRQVLDLPPLPYITTEHQVHTLACCDCGHETSGAFPEEVTHPTQYGPGVKQLAVYLRTEQFVPYQRSQQLLHDLFALPVSVGSLQNFMAHAAEQVTVATDAIEQTVAEADVVQADETGFYIGGQRHWLHTASTPRLSSLRPHRRRGRVAVDAIGVLPRVVGTLVHDAWATYFQYDAATHALCNAHHLRDLTAIIENDGQWWAEQMHRCLLAAKTVVDEAKASGQLQLSAAVVQRIDHLYDAIVAIGFEENPLPDTPPPRKRGRRKKTKARNLVERFAHRKDAVLRFVHDFKVPFDNNLAERDIRMMKVQQKVSGCFRSEAGATQFCRLRSYTSTMRKQGLSVWRAIGSLFSGDILMPQLTPV